MNRVNKLSVAIGAVLALSACSSFASGFQTLTECQTAGKAAESLVGGSAKEERFVYLQQTHVTER